MRKLILLVVCGLLFTLGVSAQLGANGFYRIRNGAAATNEDRISIVDNVLNYTAVVGAAGGAKKLALDQDGAVSKAVAKVTEYLQNDIHLVNDYVANPGTVIYIKNNSGSAYDLQAQGTGLNEIGTGVYQSSQGPVNFKNVYATIKKVSGSEANSLYTASVSITATVKILVTLTKTMGPYYFEDQSSELNINESSSSTSAKWYIEPITAESETNYFAAKPADKMKEGGKYYTSLTTAFAYQIVGDVNAYIVTGVEQKDGKQVATMKLVGGQGKIIPAYTPVILECTSTDPALNKLQPTTSAGNVDVSGNKLHGVLLKNKYKSSDNATLAAITKPTRLRVFNVNNSGKVGFYKYSGTDLSANKVYLDMADFANASSNEFDGMFTMDFSQTVSGVNEVHVEETVKDDRYYDLQGRVVEHPTRGIYIRNGRKVFVN